MTMTEANVTSAGIWIRTANNDKKASADQKKRAEAYATFKGWRVREVYNLSGVSGNAVMDHPEAKRMLADVERGHNSELIFSNLSRLSRNHQGLLEISEIFRSAEANMVSLDEKLDTSTSAGRLMFATIAALAQWESEELEKG